MDELFRAYLIFNFVRPALNAIRGLWNNCAFANQAWFSRRTKVGPIQVVSAVAIYK
jgi:hypothetical protein